MSPCSLFTQPGIFRFLLLFVFVILSSALVCADRDLYLLVHCYVPEPKTSFWGHRGCLVKSLYRASSVTQYFRFRFQSQRSNHMEYVGNCMVLHGASADQDSETGSWCGLWLAHCAVASASVQADSAWRLGFPNSARGHPISAQSLCTDEMVLGHNGMRM